jgi:hypothetical protein
MLTCLHPFHRQTQPARWQEFNKTAEACQTPRRFQSPETEGAGFYGFSRDWKMRAVFFPMVGKFLLVYAAH